ncbi:MAG TPA: HEXXH motif-containing putative peptide modification protein [Humisphaera sp.]
MSGKSTASVAAMDSWCPDAGRAAGERAAVAARMRDSLLAVVRDALPAREGQLAASLAGSWGSAPAPLGPLDLFHPDFFEWYFQAGDRVRADDLGGLADLMDRAEEVRSSVTRSRTRAAANADVLGLPADFGLDGGPAAALAAARLSEAATAAAVGAGVQLSGEGVGVVDVLTPAVAARFRAAFAAIRTYWPEMADEVTAYAARVVLLRGDDVIGASDARSLGTVYVSERETKDPLKLAEELIHEASHNALNTAAYAAPLCLNEPDERYDSPLRKDARPVFGILHQVFVLTRLVQFYRAALPAYPSRRPHLADLESRLAGGVAVLCRHARFTDAGRRLMSSITAFHAGPRPDEALNA